MRAPIPTYDIPDWPAAGPLPQDVAEQYVGALAWYFRQSSQGKAVRCTVEALRLLEPIWENGLPADTSIRVASAYPDALEALRYSYSPEVLIPFVRLAEKLPRGNLARRVGSVLFYFQLGLHFRSSWAVHLAVTVQRAGDVATRTPYGVKFFDDWRAACDQIEGQSLFE